MANGNGTQLDSNPLWTWIRPISVILFGILAIVLLAFAGFTALANGNWTMVGAIAFIGLAFLGVAFGLRTLDKMLETGINLTSMNGMSVGNKAELPKATSGQSTVATPFFEPLDDVSATEVGKTLPEDTWASSGGLPPKNTQPVFVAPTSEPFIGEEAFDKEVGNAVVGVYTEDEPDARFYEAWNRGALGIERKANFSWHDSAWITYIRKMVNRYFSFEWGFKDDSGNPLIMDSGAVEYAQEHLNDDKACVKCGKSMTGCHWITLEQKADYMGKESFRYALDKVRMVELYAVGEYPVYHIV